MATWPSSLPPPNSAYTLSPVDQTVRTDMESGAARARRRTTARNDRVKLSWRMTNDQLVIFRAWFDSDTDLQGGAAWFTVNLLIGTAGMVSTTARFIGAPTVTYLTILNWDVSGELEIRS